ncbi:hypothetical protein, partial [Methylocystis bryophila]|uniref:hypothetical protein n=1 Tax=Methylocystis bryophila TaxID=655015 RepID=UPI003EC04F50
MSNPRTRRSWVSVYTAHSDAPGGGPATCCDEETKKMAALKETVDVVESIDVDAYKYGFVT